MEIDELVVIMRAMQRIKELLAEEDQELRAGYGKIPNESSAGGPSQTLLGLQELTSAAEQTMTSLATAIGFTVAGMTARAENRIRSARHLVGFPGGASRMARPLGSRVVEALELALSLDEFYHRPLGTEIEAALAAPEPTWPPDDWAAYDRSRMTRPEP
ncbi:hypothetical protein [Streptomyces sp. NPDC056682]|uniref:hypothetical protein n=1 Tax=Streptomyces sp. NPDC056682 TaxID=3345909 RepID=UPI0036B4C918